MPDTIPEIDALESDLGIEGGHLAYAESDPGADESAGVNGDTFDRFSALHFGVGVVAGLARVHPALFVAAGVGWELAEDRLKEEVPEAFPHPSPDSKRNALGDVLSGGLGYFVGRWLRNQNA
jgi:hypothetical protein